MVFGYVNVLKELSTAAQQLKLTHCDKVLIDQKRNDKQLKWLLSDLRPGDTLLVFSIRVFPLSTLQLIQMVDDLNQRKVILESCSEHLSGQSLFSTLANYQREFRHKGIQRMNDAKRARGRNGGRKKGLSAEALQKARAVNHLYHTKNYTYKQLMETFEIGSRTTIAKYIKIGEK